MGNRENIPNKKTTERENNVDIIRIVAFAAVLGVHFFLNTEYYNEQVVGLWMYLMTIIRTMCMVCVPLFLLLTGYLESRKEIVLSRTSLWQFYRKLIGVWVVYILTAVLNLIFRGIYLQDYMGIRGSVSYLLSYPDYSWYVEMYLGLALLIPFLNLLWRAVSSKGGRRFLLAVLILLTSLPGLLNAFGYQLLPDWWQNLYPVMYYYMGAYLREYDGDRSIHHDCSIRHAVPQESANWQSHRYSFCLFLEYLVAGIATGLFCAVMSRGGEFVWGDWCDWYGFPIVVMSVLLFRFLHSLDDTRMSERTKAVVKWLSSLTLAAYLLSWIPDHLIYPLLNAAVTSVPGRFRYYIPMVAGDIVISLGLAAVVVPIAQRISGWLQKAADRILQMDHC